MKRIKLCFSSLFITKILFKGLLYITNNINNKFKLYIIILSLKFAQKIKPYNLKDHICQYKYI